jgi:hypothetical protein
MKAGPAKRSKNEHWSPKRPQTLTPIPIPAPVSNLEEKNHWLIEHPEMGAPTQNAPSSGAFYISRRVEN